MKRKTINKVIEKKIENWAASVDDSGIARIIRNKTVVTGGCIASMLLREKVNDFDVYFQDRDSLIAVVNYYKDKWLADNPQYVGREVRVNLDEETGRVSLYIKSTGVLESNEKSKEETEEAEEYLLDDLIDDGQSEERVKEEKPRYRPLFLTSNAITLSDKIQIVIRFYGDPKEIHENYDFVHCTNYWTNQDGVVLNQAALESLLTKELYYCGSKYPVCSIIRSRKFINRGWTINAGQYLKMVLQANELNLKDPQVLQDQLVGVDAAFFYRVLETLEKRDTGTEVTVPYLVEIINRIFD